MNNVIKLLQAKILNIPEILIINYQKLNLTAEELLLIIYFINNSLTFNPKEISNYFNIKLNSVLEMVNSLSDKGLIKIDIKKKGNVREEQINLEGLYQKLAFTFIEKDTKEVSTTIFDQFENEFGRTLSPIEYELINSWLENNDESLIKLALKEAVYNGVSNLRYIDKIIHEWNKKGIKNEKDLTKQKSNFKKTNKDNVTFDYDWLNENNTNN